MGGSHRVSIATVMAVVGLIAVDIGLVRASWDTLLLGLNSGVLLVILPTLDVLILTAPRLRGGRRGHRFWRGFHATSCALILLAVILYRIDIETFFRPITKIRELADFPANSPAETILLVACLLVIYVPPQWLLASLVGWLCWGLRVEIRWVNPDDGPPAGPEGPRAGGLVTSPGSGASAEGGR